VVIACDFDGVIHDWEHPIPGRHMGPPMVGAKEALERLRARGHTILIHSCNRPKVIADFMQYYGLPFNGIWEGQGKPACDCYLDDKALTFVSWADTLETLRAAGQT